MNETKFKKKPFKFNIGADPEFNITIQNKKAMADCIFPAILEKNPKTKRSNQGFQIEKAGEIGWDGCSETGEVRPLPSKYPEGVVNNLGKIFGTIASKMQLFELSTLCEKGPVGGHIHLEISDGLAQNLSLMKKYHRRLAAFYLPLLMGENLNNIKMRKGIGGYGDITDHRVQKFGNAYTYEFRVPSAEWLTTPKIAMATLAYIATVFNEILHKPKQFEKCKEILFTNDQQARALHDMTLSNFQFAIIAMTKHIKKLIKKFEYYKEYKEEIDFILNYDKVLKEKQKAEFNILKGWKMLNYQIPNKRDLMNDKKIKQIALSKDIETIEDFIKMNYSNDNNVSHFANILKQRIAAMNWKLKFTYFFFGLRKGITNFLISNGNLKMLSGAEMIKTPEERELAQQLLNRQKDRLRIKHTQNVKETTEKLENAILFGIPYAERVNSNHKKFLEMVHDIEKGKIKPNKFIFELNTSARTPLDSEFYNAMSRENIAEGAIREDDQLRYPPNASRSVHPTEPNESDETLKISPKVEKKLNKMLIKSIKYLCAE
jgi:hypothetical protein